MKFYIRIVLLAAFLTSLLSAHAQSPTITWDSTVKDLGDSNYEVGSLSLIHISDPTRP